MVEPLRHRQTKEADNRYVWPTATAPHLDSTKMRRTHIEHMLSAFTPVPTANPKQLTDARESVDSSIDERSLQVDLVRLDREVPRALRWKPKTLYFAINSTSCGGNARSEWLCVPKFNSNVLVMQSTDHGMRHDASDPLNRAGDWRIFVQ